MNHGREASRTHQDRPGAVACLRTLRAAVQGFCGFGMAGKTKSDALSTTRWDFASQLGLRFRLPGNRVTGELVMRHWSNGGIRLPNHGQDFATLTVHLNSGFFGISRAD